MSDDRPQGSCLAPGCPRDPYPRNPGERPPLVCGVCSSRLAGWLRETPDLVAELAARDAPGGVLVRSEVRETLVGWHVPDGWHPPLQLARLVQVEQLLVAGELPAAVTPGATRGGRVSGTTEPRLPVNEDALDLLARARTSTAATAPLAYPEQDGDQVGFLPVAATLDGLAEGLRLHRRRAGERRPFPAVTNLCTWLLNRLDDACADWPGIGELFDEVRLAYGALRAQCGYVDVIDWKKGVQCPKCHLLSALAHHPGAEHIVCSACGVYMTFDEYEEHVMTLATALSAEKREQRKRAAADRLALARLLRGLRTAGWQRTTNYVPSERDPDGAPYHEGYLEHVWTRPGERLWAWWRIDPRQPIWSISLGAVEGDEEVDARLDVSVSWVVANGVRRLHHLAAAAGVLTASKERP